MQLPHASFDGGLVTPLANIVLLFVPGTMASGVLSGPNSLAGLRFQGKKFALELGEASDAMQAGSSK